jgi:hypothetical protein
MKWWVFAFILGWLACSVASYRFCRTEHFRELPSLPWSYQWRGQCLCMAAFGPLDLVALKIHYLMRDFPWNHPATW